MKLEFFSTNFRKILKYQLAWKSVHWEQSCSIRTGGQTGGYDKADSHFSQFCEGVKKYGPHMNWATIKPECTDRDSVLA